jgi:hypothetical protein
MKVVVFVERLKLLGCSSGQQCDTILVDRIGGLVGRVARQDGACLWLRIASRVLAGG